MATGILRVPRPSRVSAAVAARVGKPVVDPRVVQEVLQHYDLRVIGSNRNVRLARRSLNVAVRTSAGVKVVKQYRPQWTEPTVRHAHSILVHLAEVAFPAVRVASTVNGATHACVQDRVFGVFDLVQGTNYSLNYLMRSDRMALTRTAGRTLAQLHQSLENCVPDGQHHMGFASLTGTRHRDVAWHTVKIEELQGRSAALDEPEAASRAGSLVARAERLLEEITTLEHRLSQAEFPRLVIHGDYGLHNLLFDGRDMAVVVDFELARLDWRLNDLISVLGKHRYRGGHYDLDSMETFVRAYTSVFPLTADERDLLVDAWRLYKLQAAVQYWNSYFETSGPVRKLESAIDSLGQADLVATRPDLIDRLKCATSSAASPRGVGTNAGSSKPPRQPGAVDGGDS